MTFYAEYKCKFCGKDVSESYPPSLSMATVNDEERTIKPVKYFMTDICTDCFNRFHEEWIKAKDNKESYVGWRTGFLQKIKELYPEWSPWGISFIDSMFGSGCPNIFLIVKEIPEGVDLEDEGN